MLQPVCTNCMMSLGHTHLIIASLLLLCHSGGGLRASVIPDVMPAGVSTPGKFNHAGQALAERPD